MHWWAHRMTSDIPLRRSSRRKEIDSGCSFRIVQEDRPIFYEFWVVEVDQSRPALKLKHFNAHRAGWEEKNAGIKMPLVSHSEDDAVFAEADGGVSLHHHPRGNAPTCTVHHVRDSKGSDESFSLTKAP